MRIKEEAVLSQPTKETLRTVSLNTAFTGRLSCHRGSLLRPICAQRFNQNIQMYARIKTQVGKLDDSEYSFDDIVSAPVPDEGSAFYWSSSAPDDDINLSLNLSVTKNGYATFSVMYIFPEAIEEKNKN